MLSPQQRVRYLAWATVVLGCTLGSTATRSADAHKGPPFPIFLDERVAEYSVSVWADPDIGDAYFYLIVETSIGEAPDEAPRVSMWTEPVSGRLERVNYEATQQDLRNRMQFEIHPYFDQGDMWNIGFRIEPVGREAGELVTQIESTPPGYGLWDFAIYLFPFVLLAGMWIVAVVRRLRAASHVCRETASSRREDLPSEPALATPGREDWK